MTKMVENRIAGHRQKLRERFIGEPCGKAFLLISASSGIAFIFYRLWKFRKEEVDEWMRSCGGTEKHKNGAEE